MAAGSAGSTSVDTDGATLFTSRQGQRATAVKIKNTHESSTILVNVAPLHTANEFDVLAAGEKEYYRAGTDGISSVFVKSSTGSVTVNHSIVAVLIG